MEIKHIFSTDLPDIDKSVKECVNNGRWRLFKTHQPEIDISISYFIKGNDKLYRLDKSGKVISIGLLNEAPAMDEIIYFSDMPMPRSLSEGVPKGCYSLKI